MARGGAAHPSLRGTGSSRRCASDHSRPHLCLLSCRAPVTSHEGADGLQLGAASCRAPPLTLSRGVASPHGDRHTEGWEGPAPGSTAGLLAAQPLLPRLSQVSSGRQPTRSGLGASGPPQCVPSLQGGQLGRRQAVREQLDEGMDRGARALRVACRPGFTSGPNFCLTEGEGRRVTGRDGPARV